MYIDSSRSWMMHGGKHTDRTDGGIAVGSTVGVLVDFARRQLFFYVDGERHGPAIGVDLRPGALYFPAASLNRNVQLTLSCGLEVPVDVGGPSNGD